MLSSTDIYDNSKLPRDLCGIVEKYISHDFLPSRKELTEMYNKMLSDKYYYLNVLISEELKHQTLQLSLIKQNFIQVKPEIHWYYEDEIDSIRKVPIIHDLERLGHRVTYSLNLFVSMARTPIDHIDIHW